MSKSKKFVELNLSFRLELSNEFYERIQDQEELQKFILHNCFRNNNRFIQSYYLKDLKLYAVKNPQDAKEDQLTSEGYLGMNGRKFIYKHHEALKKAKRFNGEIEMVDPNNFKPFSLHQ